MSEQGILLQEGTGEFEMLSFSLDGNTYGINVSKVKEIIKFQPITSIPNSDTRILGMFMPRDELITAVDLRMCLLSKPSNPDPKNYLILTHFNNITTAFQVDSVKDIKRIRWEDIISPGSVVNQQDSSITGIVKLNNEIISILDFEKIMTDINVNNGLSIETVENMSDQLKKENLDRDIHLMVADDSKMLNQLITNAVKDAGYYVSNYYDGQALYDSLLKLYNDGKINLIDAIISDIEMPKLNGTELCKKLKEDDRFKSIPVVLFSSLADDQMKKKAEAIGADGCISKPDLPKVLEIINNLIK